MMQMMNATGIAAKQHHAHVGISVSIIVWI